MKCSTINCVSAAVFLGYALFFTPPNAHAFDCAKAATPTEEAICTRANLKSQDGAMTRTYFAVRKTLDKAAKSQLLSAQKNWLKAREATCGADSDCLLDMTGRWTITLNTLKPGMVPVFIWRKGSKRQYKIQIEGVRFANANNKAERIFNRAFDAEIAQAPMNERFEEGLSITPEYEMSLEINTYSRKLISANVNHADYSGAHPSYWTNSINIDVANGRPLKTTDLFTNSAIARLTDECRDKVIAVKYETENGTLDEKRQRLEQSFPGIVAQHILDMKQWRFLEREVNIGFDKYDIGSGVETPYDCTFPNSEIARILIDPSLLAK